MNAPERATLRDLFTEIGKLSDKVDDHFDVIEARMRDVEQELITYRAAETVRREHKVGIRWGISTIVSVVGIASGVAATVVTVILRVLG